MKTFLSGLQYAPYFGTLLVFLGAVRLFLFYQYYDISIMSYLEFSEVLISFMDNIIIFSALGSISGVFFSWMISLDIAEQKRIEASGEANASADLKSGKRQLILYLTLLAILLAFLFWKNVNMAITMVIWLCIGWLFIVIRRSAKESPLLMTVISCMLGLLFLVTLVGVLSINEARIVRKFAKSIRTTILFKDGNKFESTSQDFVIGNTRNYLFIQHDSDTSFSVYRMDDIKSLHEKILKRASKSKQTHRSKGKL